MFRSAGKIIGGAAGIAATGPAVSAQCRSQQPRIVTPAFVQDELHKRAEGSQKPAPGLNEEWLVTDLKHALEEDQVIFGEEEINETMQSVFAFSAGDGRPATQSAFSIREVVEEGHEEVEELDDTSVYMKASDMQMMPPQELVREDFNRMLSKLLHNDGVQRACITALKDDQVFLDILDSPGSSPITVPVRGLLPSNAGGMQDQAFVAEEGEGHNGFIELINNIASGIMQLGDVIRQKAVGARNLIGKLFIELGCNLHQMLGQPFGSTPVDEASEQVNEKAEMVGKALITVACAILTLVLVKRVHHIRFV